MKTKAVSGIMLTLLLIGILTLAFNIQPAKAEPTTWTVDDDGPADFHVIQEAINAASLGDTTFVHSGTYYENLVVDKSLTLIGESKDSTIVDGGGENRSVIEVTANKVVINKFTVQNSSRRAGTSYAGIKVLGRACNITGNHVTKNKIGIYVTSQKSIIAENIATKNGHGIALYSSSEVTVRANNVSANTVGISLALSSNNIIVDNIATNSSLGGHGIIVSSNSFNNTIFSNDLINNYHGMWLSGSSSNWIVENTIANNELLGVELASSLNNTFYHNNFINNPKHIVIDSTSISTWDDGYPSGGNYWSDYEERYPDAVELDSSGIWDTPYVINENNTDRYPLMDPHVDTTLPTISIVSPENKTYPVNDIPLTFTVSELTSWVGYSLDGQANVTIIVNTTLSELSDGPHSIIVYAKDTAGNTGASEMIYFTIETEKEEPFPTWIVALIVIAGIAVLAGAIYFLKKRKPPTPTAPTPPTEGTETSIE